MTSSATEVLAPKIRRATDADLSAVLALLEASALPTVGVEEALGGFFVAESDEKIVGTVGIETCREKFALLRSAAVADAWRGRGLGRRLVERAIAEARAKNIAALYLLTTTAETYFPSFGFTAVTRDTVPAEVRATEEFSSACPASATVMTLGLNS